jgi:hypothetical protein
MHEMSEDRYKTKFIGKLVSYNTGREYRELAAKRLKRNKLSVGKIVKTTEKYCKRFRPWVETPLSIRLNPYEIPNPYKKIGLKSIESETKKVA